MIGRFRGNNSCLIVLLSLAFTAAAQAQLPKHGKHFILLMDDSKDFSSERRLAAQLVPEWLFQGSSSLNSKMQSFDPRRDALSVMYFALGRSSSPCKERKYVVEWSAEDLFGEQNFEQKQLKDQRSFTRWLDGSGRFDGCFSPIGTAPIFAPGFAQRQLDQDAVFSDLLVVVVSNERFNFANASPSTEIDKSVRDFRARGAGHAKGLAGQVTTFFNYDQVALASDEKERIFYRMFTLTPRRTPLAALNYDRHLEISPVAVGKSRLLGVSRYLGGGGIWIHQSELRPLSLAWRLRDKAGAPWGPGLNEGTIDLQDCVPPRCTKDGDSVVVNLFSSEATLLEAPPSAGPLRAGTLSFEVGFRYNTPVYDRLYVQSETQEIAFTPTTPPKVRFLLFHPTVGDRLQNLLFKSWLDGGGPAGGLTQEAAASRLQTLNLASWLILLAVLGFVLVRAVRASYLCAFEPTIEWIRLADVTVDLNRPSQTRLLIGSIVVANQGKPGWLGRLWGNLEQPSREAKVRLGVDHAAALERLGVKVEGTCPVGFLDPHGQLCLETRELVFHGRQLHVFLAEESLADYLHGSGAVIGEVALTVESVAELSSTPSAGVRGASFAVTTPIRFDLRMKPEDSRVPRVSWQAEKKAEHRYATGAVLPIGRFLVESTAQKVFARPYLEDCSLLATREGQPLSSEAFSLKPTKISLGSGGTATMVVSLQCGAADVVNPDPASHAYAFSLQGKYVAAFDPSELRFALQRDRTRSEIELRLFYRGHELELFWDRTAQNWSYLHSAAGCSNPVTAELLAGVLHLGPIFPFQFTRTQERRSVLDIEVGNSATSGNGEVRVAVRPRLKISDSALLRLKLQKGWGAEELVRFDGAGPEHHPEFSIKEGSPAQRGSLRLCNDAIERINGAEIRSDQCSVEVTFDIKIVTDAGEAEDRLLQVSIPMHMEQEPGQNWLVLDFGTSAIAAAVGVEGLDNHAPLIDLQMVEVSPNTRLNNYDLFNLERGTPFLPSCVVVDGDLRQYPTVEGQTLPAGFPGHTGMKGAAQGPPAASYVALPAATSDLVQRPERVIYSLKSWLGANGSEIVMPVEVACNGRLTKRLPLDEMVVSALTALVEAYLLHSAPAAAAEQAIVCHPNNFTFMHRNRLKRLACSALLGRLPIVAEKHVHLVSESDAVGYAYCWDRMAEEPRDGSQRLLVYDMGAGTLDLSFVDIEWSRDPFYPIPKARYHLGVAVAGHYFDEVLARIVHETLETVGVLSTPAVQYRYPVVGRPEPETQVTTSSGLAHASAARLLWDAIRQAKVEWGGQERLEIVVGSTHESRHIINHDTNRGLPLSDEPPEGGDPPGLFLRQADIVLSLPRAAVVGHPRMQALLKFVTADVVDEILALAGGKRDDVDTVVMSGRGSQWPGLSEALRSNLRDDLELVSFSHGHAMKAAVARGAIAHQTLLTQFEDDAPTTKTPRFALIYGHGKGIDAVFEEDWGNPVKIPGATFRLVQVSLQAPDPGKDLTSGSLRRFFYVDVARHEYHVRDCCGPDHLLTLVKEDRGGAISIRMRRSDGVETPVEVGSAGTSLRPGWPIGTALLAPDGFGT